MADFMKLKVWSNNEKTYITTYRASKGRYTIKYRWQPTPIELKKTIYRLALKRRSKTLKVINYIMFKRETFNRVKLRRAIDCMIDNQQEDKSNNKAKRARCAVHRIRTRLNKRRKK